YWRSDVCSSDLPPPAQTPAQPRTGGGGRGSSPLVFGAALVGVAVVAGCVWGLIRSGGGGGVTGTPEPAPPPSTTNPLTSGRFSYEVVAGPTTATDCSANSYGDMVEWFA